MQIETNKVDETKVQIDIRIPKSTLDSRIDEVAKSFQPRVNVKGFRKGKVPLNVVKGQFSQEIMAEATTRLVYEGTSEALKERDLKNVSNPVLLEEFRPTKTKGYTGKVHLDGSFSFSVTVELPPEIDVQDYKGVEIEVDAKDFDGWFKKKIKEQQMLYGEKKLADRPAREGDELVIDFEGFHADGTPMEGGGEEGYRLLIGEGNFLRDFEYAFVDKSPGEDFDVDVQFPEDYPQEELAGQIITFKCKLNEIHELVPHPLDDELAMLMSYENVDAMMEAHKQIWEEQWAEPIRAQLFSAIMEKLLEAHEFEVPQAWVDAEVQNTLHRLSLEGADQQPAIDSIREISERTVKIAYVLDKIYEKEEDIHFEVDEFKAVADKEAKKHGLASGSELIEHAQKTNQYEGFVTFHEQQKTIDFLIENAVIKEKE